VAPRTSSAVESASAAAADGRVTQCEARGGQRQARAGVEVIAALDAAVAEAGRAAAADGERGVVQHDARERAASAVVHDVHGEAGLAGRRAYRQQRAAEGEQRRHRVCVAQLLGGAVQRPALAGGAGIEAQAIDRAWPCPPPRPRAAAASRRPRAPLTARPRGARGRGSRSCRIHERADRGSKAPSLPTQRSASCARRAGRARS
jgi:hypothetical protein